MQKLFLLLGCILGSNLLGAAGSIFTSPKITNWYTTLAKPNFNPPNWIFGLVWALLFTLMGIAFYLVIKNGLASREVKLAVVFFVIQFIFNIAWSYLFFGLENPLYGLINIIVLWLMILVTIFAFYRVNPIASYLLIPYILWVSFAAVLNYNIWFLNK